MLVKVPAIKLCLLHGTDIFLFLYTRNCGGGKMMEKTITLVWTQRINILCVIFHHFQERRHLGRVFYPALHLAQLGMEGGGHLLCPGVQPGQGGGAHPRVVC